VWEIWEHSNVEVKMIGKAAGRILLDSYCGKFEIDTVMNTLPMKLRK
jgi:hypothetical protein